ncbi:hypothetical protein BLOT_005324 [Blomia tropicalis]|nr:hypothetical protein BLOT_005324 [Blomia tropicalis]
MEMGPDINPSTIMLSEENSELAFRRASDDIRSQEDRRLKAIRFDSICLTMVYLSSSSTPPSRSTINLFPMDSLNYGQTILPFQV